MYAVGRLGSYITQGVYTVSGPFHPFGGAVDMVVVQQQDGSLKSSPWYVRFGKFQGVLKVKERVVDINVNGIDADFPMYLDPRGEAYFLREVDSEEIERAVSSHSSSCEDIDGKRHDKIPIKSKSMDYGCDQSNSVSDVSKRSRILGFVQGRRSMKERILSNDENDSNVGQIAADLMEVRWSTNLSSRNDTNDCGDITGGRLESSLVLHEQHFVNKDTDENHVSDDPDEAEVGLVTGQGLLDIVPEIYTREIDETNEIRPLDHNVEFQDVFGVDVVIKQVPEQIVEEQLIFGDLDQEVNQVETESTGQIYGQDPLQARTHQEQLKVEIEGLKGNFRRCPTNVDIPRTCEFTTAEISRQAKSLPNISCQFNDPVLDNHEEPQFYSPVGKFRSSTWDLLREEASRIKKANLENKLPPSGDNLSNDLKDGDVASGGSWSLWPFRRSVIKNVSENSKKDTEVEIVAETDGEKDESSPKSDKVHTRAITPTAEQLASLNLAEGQNTVTFTFSTSVLGPQKVDARIYLWRWDTRIVISDVDGTITKSDVLGQFMPLVGRDWSHIGVTHLFSGIKENGYQMLYLSARAISQASITRQFLFNLKQDGKALPDGPVVISPDGLFPSLFREVIRRAPHEFKIACLEDIKACFPADRNPFYAGFGNRDTDEFSYLKVGIPKGKIFIINPKGEVIINRCIDSKSYASLHALVNGIFPPISGHEEEDYNSWNFWKLPPPTIA